MIWYLPSHIEKPDVVGYFAKFGQVLSLYFNGGGRYGYVRYATVDEAAAALDDINVRLGGILFGGARCQFKRRLRPHRATKPIKLPPLPQQEQQQQQQQQEQQRQQQGASITLSKGKEKRSSDACDHSGGIGRGEGEQEQQEQPEDAWDPEVYSDDEEDDGEEGEGEEVSAGRKKADARAGGKRKRNTRREEQLQQ
eukprot:g24.t1